MVDRFGLGYLKTVKDAKDQADSAVAFMYPGGQFNKQNGKQFLDAVDIELNSPQASPVSKLMTLHVLKQLTYSGQTKFFSLVGGHKLLDFMLNQARTIDPKKSINDKGLKKFKNQPDTGRQYMRLLLQLSNFWGQKFGRGRNSEPTKFKKNLNQLKSNNVVLPPNYEIFDQAQYKAKKKNRDANVAQGLANSVQGSNAYGLGGVASTPDPASRTTGKLATQLRFTIDKIKMYIGELQDTQDTDKLQNLIHTNHASFVKQKAKYQARAAQIQTSQDEVVSNYFAVQHFLSEEDLFYNKYIPINDYSSYLAQVKLLNQNTFLKGHVTAQEVQPLLGALNKLGTPNLNIGSMVNPPVNPSNTVNRSNSGATNTNTRDLMNNLYSRLQQKSRSKSPVATSGFKAVQMELQKEKQMAKKNPIRRSSRSPRNLSRSGTGLNQSNASNLRQSKVHPIFTSPPNKYVSAKNFEGQTIMESKQLMRALYGLKKDQGTRRFKISNFRQKNPLFQNQQIQVGYKSQAVYQQIGQFSHFIFLNLYIGNKTDQGIKDFQVEYKADSNQLLYANPRTVDSIIPAGYQNKHDLMITPISVPYTFMTMNISYKFKNTAMLASIILPNSILKYASYRKTSKSDFDMQWNKASRKFKTNQFKLCQNLPPDSFAKWIPSLDYITTYTEFSREGSQTDLQMFCMVDLLRRYDGALKINIRPNLQVVLQLGVLDSNSQAVDNFRFYLETLQLILKQIAL